MEGEQLVKFGAFGVATLVSYHRKWDEGTHNTIREISVAAGPEIHSIQIVYDSEGNAVVGKSVVAARDTICGYYGIHSANKTSIIVKSLSFQSNKHKFGPYGKEEGTYFITPLTVDKIVGFFGVHANCLDSIGVYVKPLKVAVTVGPFGTTGGQQWDDRTYSARDITEERKENWKIH
ncbi:jacalin-related lectin 3-like [Cornus florida]|uniref:jacalin-related lectin 3-like n=1 Tax=Cornus florida TaxID=4283 RepID=UPI002899905A|nr:jacalin-related lectin 3-like [Cornus florida]